MKGFLSYIFVFILLISCGRSQEEIDAAAQKMFEDNLEELKITADEACTKKRTDYVNLYKDSLAKANTVAPIGDE